MTSVLPVQTAIDWQHDTGTSTFGLVSLDDKGQDIAWYPQPDPA